MNNPQKRPKCGFFGNFWGSSGVFPWKQRILRAFTTIRPMLLRSLGKSSMTNADEYGDKRQFMGAMAATITDESTRNYALKQGLFVIDPSGDDVKVTKPDGEVRVWQAKEK
jgi:hypothetical protein